MKEDIIRLCSEIRANSKCDGCGGECDNHTCKYCGKENQILDRLIMELCSKLVELNAYDDDILKSLYSIRDLNIKMVNDLINYNNYGTELKERYNNILYMVSIDRCGTYACHNLIYFLDNDLFISGNRNNLINFLMKKLLTFELGELDIQDILILIKLFTEMFMSNKFKNSKCVYQKLDEGTLGSAFWKFIHLDQDSIVKMIEAGDLEGILQLVFHECTHTTQDYRMMFEKKVSYNILVQCKEQILRNIIPKYYDNNYVNNNAEVEARYFGAYLTIWYLNLLGLPVLNEDYFKNIMKSEAMYIFYDKRIINGVEITVDEAFSMYVSDSEYLERFPVLNIQYKNNNGKIELKEREEILSDYEKYKSGELLLNGEVADIEFLYDYLLGNSKNKGNNI